MAKKPSERRNFKEEEMELNLTPMMNLISILIPVLLVSTAFVEIAVINVSAPAIGSAPQDQQETPQQDKPPLNLNITVTEKGYTVSTFGQIRPGKSGEQGAPTIPITEKSISCSKYVGTMPPPRKKNEAGGKCEVPAEGQDAAMRTFWVYDTEALQKLLVELKDESPDEIRMIIAAEPDIEFEVITDIMDTGRSIKDEGGEMRILFDEVVLSPGLG